MSIQDIQAFELPRFPEAITTAPTIGGSTNFDITLTAGYVAYVDQMPFTTTIDSVFFKISTSTGNYPMVARLENVSLGTGAPNGILINPSASAEVRTTATANANYEVRFPQPFTVSRGTLFSIVLAASTRPAVSGNGIRFADFDDDNTGNTFPYVVDNSAPPGTAIAFRTTVSPMIGIGLSAVSGVPLQHCWPMREAPPAIPAFRSPVTHGNKITIRSKVRASGAVVWGDVATSSAAIVLYGTDGFTLSALGYWNPFTPNNTTVGKSTVLFSSTVDLGPGTYYLAVSGGNAASNTTMYYASFTAPYWRGSSPFGGTDVMYISSGTTPTGPGQWIEVDTRQAFLGLLIDGIDDGSVNLFGGETSSIFFA
jgi:hypothetical protein